jgi:hypothetical protein
MAQFRDDAAVPRSAKRLVATAVLGVLVWYLNVTVFVLFFDHEPVNVQTRNTFATDATCGCSKPNGG